MQGIFRLHISAWTNANSEEETIENGVGIFRLFAVIQGQDYHILQGGGYEYSQV